MNKYIIIGIAILLILFVGYLYSRQESIEDFCIVCSSSKSVTVMNSVLNNTINKTILKYTQNCQNKISASQIINIQCSPSDAVQQQYLNMKLQCQQDVLNYNSQNKTQLDPQSLCQQYVPCYIQGITQNSTISFKSQCTIDTSTYNKMYDDFKSQIEDQYTSNTDGFTDALNSLVSGVVQSSAGGSSSAKYNTTDDIKNSLINVFDQQTVQNIINAFVANQTINIKSSGGVVATGLNQQNMLTIQQDIINQNSTYNDLMNTLDSTVSTQTNIQSRGVTDIVSSFFSFLTSSTISMVIASVCCLLIIGLVIVGLWYGLSEEDRGAVASKGIDVASSAVAKAGV